MLPRRVSSKTKCNKRVPPLGEEKETTSNTNKKRETVVPQRLINFVLYMYHQLTSEQRSQIFALFQKKTARKEIARIVGTSEATLSRELERNSTPYSRWRRNPPTCRLCRNCHLGSRQSLWQRRSGNCCCHTRNA